MTAKCNRRDFLTKCGFGIAALGFVRPGVIYGQDRNKPNILWIIVEDMSCHFGCYGETSIRTPNVDRLAAEGVKFDKAFVTAPVCSPCRSALITGINCSKNGDHFAANRWAHIIGDVICANFKRHIAANNRSNDDEQTLFANCDVKIADQNCCCGQKQQ